MKSRDTRVPVNLQAQMSSDLGREAAFILNASSRGLALRAIEPPARGAYVELRAGSEVIVARVIWADGEYFGVRTQSPIPPGMRPLGARNRDGAFGGLQVAMTPAAAGAADILDQSLARARNMQFAFLVTLALCAAMIAAAVMRNVLAGPIDAARTELAHTP